MTPGDREPAGRAFLLNAQYSNEGPAHHIGQLLAELSAVREAHASLTAERDALHNLACDRAQEIADLEHREDVAVQAKDAAEARVQALEQELAETRDLLTPRG